MLEAKPSSHTTTIGTRRRTSILRFLEEGHNAEVALRSWSVAWPTKGAERFCLSVDLRWIAIELPRSMIKLHNPGCTNRNLHRRRTRKRWKITGSFLCSFPLPMPIIIKWYALVRSSCVNCLSKPKQLSDSPVTGDEVWIAMQARLRAWLLIPVCFEDVSKIAAFYGNGDGGLQKFLHSRLTSRLQISIYKWAHRFWWWVEPLQLYNSFKQAPSLQTRCLHWRGWEKDFLGPLSCWCRP